MTDNITRKNHYIPKVHLKHFADEQSVIHCFDTTNEVSYSKKITDKVLTVGFENNLYDQKTEDYLAIFDDRYNSIVTWLSEYASHKNKHKSIHTIDNTHNATAQEVALMTQEMLSMKDIRDETGNLDVSCLLKKTKEWIGLWPMRRQTSSYLGALCTRQPTTRDAVGALVMGHPSGTQQIIERSFLHQIYEATMKPAGLGNVFHYQWWDILRAPVGAEFIIGDGVFWPTVGALVKNSQCIFPISKTLALLTTAIGEPAGNCWKIGITDLNKKQVREINQEILRHSYRVYGSNKEKLVNLYTRSKNHDKVIFENWDKRFTGVILPDTPAILWRRKEDILKVDSKILVKG